MGGFALSRPASTARQPFRPVGTAAPPPSLRSATTRQAAPDIDFTRVTLFAIVGGRADTPVGKPLVESVITADGENVVV